MDVSVTFEFVEELDTDSDYGFEFVDQVMETDKFTGDLKAAKANGKTDKIGDTEVNRMQVLIPGKAALGPYEAVTEEGVGDIGAHEFGHSVGLHHPQKKGPNKGKSQVNGIPMGMGNLMRHGRSGNIKINASQRSIMYQNTKEPKKIIK